MTTISRCRHHGVEERFDGEDSHLYCGCDGTVHMACRPAPAPSGTPRPEGWPFFLAWRTAPVVPPHAIPETDRICPGSVFTPTSTGKCLCGLERGWHVWAHDGRGGFVRVWPYEEG